MRYDQVNEPGAYRPVEDERASEQLTSGAELMAWQDEVERENGPDGERGQTPGRPWRAEMARWLLTLNPGRTQDEYAKAVRYFFETNGVPQDLEDLTADLLLAYRGALAMRAERPHTRRPSHRAPVQAAARWKGLWGQAGQARTLPGDEASDMPPESRRPGPLAPATVNIRLTALRQFLRFAALRQPIASLTTERIQMALRRLPIERRRPYQILSEEEWPAFLAVARLPLESPEKPPERSPSAHAPAIAAVSPWGRTRAARERARLEQAPFQGQTVDGGEADSGAPLPHAGPSRSGGARDGRTGARTSLRDYALVALALMTGLRAIELSLLDVGDLTRERRHGRDEWWLTLPDEKTKGQRGGRTLPLAPELMAALLNYIASTARSLHSAADRATPLFLALPRGPRPAASARMHRLRPEQIRSVINRIETQWIARQHEGAGPGAETRRISPHALRHSAAIALLKGNESSGRPPASVEHVRGWLGHFDIRTTQRYLDHLNSREERRRFTISPVGVFMPLPRPAQTETPDEKVSEE